MVIILFYRAFFYRGERPIMIRSKDDFKQYILADMKSLGMEYPSIKLRVKTLLSPPPADMEVSIHAS